MTQINNVIGIEVRRRLMDIEDLKHLSAEAQQRSLSAEEMARLAELLSKSTKAELDQIVIEGDSSVEAAQARVDAKGEPHDTLKARLDAEQNEVSGKLADMTQFVNVNTFGAVADGTTDNTAPFQAASNYANSKGLPVYIPFGRYYIKGTVDFYTSVFGEGIIILHFDDAGYGIHIKSNNPLIGLGEVAEIGGLEEGSSRLNGLPRDIVGDDLFIRSHEVLINRNNIDNREYYKRDAFVVQSREGDVLPPVDRTYEDKDLIHSFFTRKREVRKLTWEGITFEFVGNESGQRGCMLIERSSVEVNCDGVVNNSTNCEIYTGFKVDWASDVEFRNIKMNGARYDGFGYGISIGSACFIRIIDCDLLECRHAISGRHGKNVTVNGGQYRQIDSHWGLDYRIMNARLLESVLYAGKDIYFENCEIYTSYSALTIRHDTPELKGKVIFKDVKIYSTSDDELSPNLIYIDCEPQSRFDWGRPLNLPNRIKVDDLDMYKYGSQKRVDLIKFGSRGYGVPHKPINHISFNNVYSNADKLHIDILDAKSDHSIPSTDPTIKLSNTKNIKLELWDSTSSLDNFLINFEINNCELEFIVESSLIKKASINNSKLTRVHPHVFDKPLGGDIIFNNCDISGVLRIENYYKMFNCNLHDIDNFNTGHLANKLKASNGNTLEKNKGLPKILINHINPNFYEVQ